MLDLEPVLDALPPVQTGGSNATFTNATRVLGVGPNKLRRWQRDGLTVPEAEDVADHLHRHPTELWEDWYQAIQSVCACGCGERFTPTRAGHRYSSKACRNRVLSRESARRRYATDPAYRAAKLKSAADYYRDAKPYVIARQRAWENANRDRVNARRRARAAERRKVA